MRPELEQALAGRDAHRHGDEIAFRCPSHDDGHASAHYNTAKRVWDCKGCGAHGGEKSLYEALGLPWTPDPALGHGTRATWSGDLPAGIRERQADGSRLSLIHAYRDAGGEVIGYAVRYNLVGSKKVLPYFKTGHDHAGSRCWRPGAPAEPRPLYGLHRLGKYPDADVWVVEGEKCVDALIALRILAVTSQGGSKAARKTDWTPLQGRNVVIWPDNDAPGLAYAATVKGILGKIAAGVQVLSPAACGLEGKGADVADWIEAHPGATKKDIEALTATSGPRESSEVEGDDLALRLECDKHGRPRCTDANLYEIFLRHEAWRGRLAWNVRTLELIAAQDAPIGLRAGERLADRHASQAASWLHLELGMPAPRTGPIVSAMIAAGQAQEFDPVREWLESLPAWDGTSRADLWLPMICGCADTTYTRAVGSKVLISAVARVFDPGCKVDTVMVLHGPQGTMKSTLLEVLAGRSEWFTDHIADIGGKDAAMQICGPWIVEFSELDAITGKRESEKVKAWITQRHDRFRPPYGRNVVNIPRRVIFTGTSNLDHFLRDETGGRRFWPVEIREIDIDGLRSCHSQLWVEALHRYRAGEKWWLEGEALAAAKIEQEDRRLADPWEAYIAAWLQDTEIKLSASSQTHSSSGRRIFTTAREILTDCLKMEISRAGKSEQDRCGRILGRVLGWTRGKRRVDGAVVSVWYPPPPASGADVINMTVAGPPPDDEGTNGY